MRETLLIICSCVKEGPRGPKGNSQKRKVTNGYKAYHTRFLPKSQDFDWKRRESAAIDYFMNFGIMKVGITLQ